MIEYKLCSMYSLQTNNVVRMLIDQIETFEVYQQTKATDKSSSQCNSKFVLDNKLYFKFNKCAIHCILISHA